VVSIVALICIIFVQFSVKIAYVSSLKGEINTGSLAVLPSLFQTCRVASVEVINSCKNE